MAATICANALIDAIASLYSYDDPACHPANSSVTGVGVQLKFVGDALDYLPPNYRRHLSQETHSRGMLYCHAASNTLILAFTGSSSVTPPLGDLSRIGDWIDDWLNTNIAMHIGDRPRQYEFAEDAADEIEKRLSYGGFDGICGSDRPKFVLTGHSKGGGQAQFAAVRISLEAVVFNSDPVNPVIFADWMLTNETTWLERGARTFTMCFGLSSDHDLQRYIAYLENRKIRDVRTVNDPVSKFLLHFCNPPHAPIEWLVNTLSCSTDGNAIEAVIRGHLIETVVRELQACADQP
jgi:hypothetical protein